MKNVELLPTRDYEAGYAPVYKYVYPTIPLIPPTKSGPNQKSSQGLPRWTSRPPGGSKLGNENKK